MFPLLALLFEKCELATQSAEYPSSESFDIDIQAFVQHQEQDRKPFFSDDPEVDGLVHGFFDRIGEHFLMAVPFFHVPVDCLDPSFFYEVS